MFLAPAAFAQIDARMLQYPDVSATQIVFVYAGDLWLVPQGRGHGHQAQLAQGTEAVSPLLP